MISMPVILSLKVKSWIPIFWRVFFVKKTNANSSDPDAAVSEETNDVVGDGKEGPMFGNKDEAV